MLEKELYKCVASDVSTLYFCEKSGSSETEFERFKLRNHDTRAHYYSIDRFTRDYREITTITDKKTLALQADEESYIHDKIVGGYYTNSHPDFDRAFSSQVLFAEIYAPLFILNDTVVLFDYVSGSCLCFYGGFHREIPIDYHQHADWKREMYVDAVLGNVYAVFEKKGLISLCPVDWKRGQLLEPVTIPLAFPQLVKVNNGFIYYLATANNTGNTRFLSRMPL